MLVLLGLIVLGFLLARLQSSAAARGDVDIVSSIARRAVAPAASAMNAFAYGTSDFAGAVTQGRSLQRENERLRALAASAETYQADVDRLRAEIDLLRKTAGWKTSPGRIKVAADVIGYFPAEGRITISAGSNQGIKPGMPVATYAGLVGRIETVDREASQVLLITAGSTSSRISALVQRTPPNPPSAGLLRGEGPNSLILELADPAATVESGDLVTTSGFSSMIPRGIVIGKVVSVQDDLAFGRRTATIFPAVALGRIREVLVIK